jgi:hypothetical protein
MRTGALLDTERQTVPLSDEAKAMCGNTLRIVEEVATSREVAENLCAARSVYEPFYPAPIRTYLDNLNPGDENNGKNFYSDVERSMTLSAQRTADPVTRFSERMVGVHELFHLIYDHLKRTNPKALESLQKAYGALAANTRYRLPTPEEVFYLGYPVTELEPAIGALTEFPYHRRVSGIEDSRSGHPWDDPSELGASTAANLYGYPRELLNTFKKVEPKDQEVIYEAVNGTINALESLNSDPRALSEALPQAAHVRNAMATTVQTNGPVAPPLPRTPTPQPAVVPAAPRRRIPGRRQ